MATYATLVTSMGDIKVKLLPDHAPNTVANFVGLATGEKEWTHPRTGEKHNDSLYAGTIFHRVIPDFMIQAGDPLGQGIGGPGYKFEDEFAGGPSLDGPGYLAMANSGPGTNGSQFFVTVAATAWLTGKHTVFGKVTVGQDVANKISRVATRSGDKPIEDVVLQEVKISEEE